MRNDVAQRIYQCAQRRLLQHSERAELLQHRLFRSVPEEMGGGAGRILASDEEYTSTVFGDASVSHLAVGEGSPWYLISKAAPMRIRSYNPDARIIVMLRNPVSLAPSMHSEELFSFNESARKFERAWNLQEERCRGRCIPTRCLEPQVVLYRTSCMLGAHVKRLYDVFPREQVLPILFDRFAGDTKAVYSEVLNFLDLPVDGRSDFPKVNPRKGFRFGALIRLGNSCLGNLVQKAKKVFGIESLGIWPRLHRWNVQDKKPEVLSVKLRRDMLRTFSADIELLEKLLGWDLSQWRKID